MGIDYLLMQLDSGVRIGYSAELGWVTAGTRDDSIEPIEEDKIFKAVALLESEPESMLERITRINVLFPEAKPFPLAELVRSAFVTHRPHWAEKAAQWYPYLQEADKRALAPALNEVAQGKKWATQKLRQFAEREARKLMP